MMYLALGVGIPIKGLVGLVIPGIVFFLYIALRRRWRLLRKMYLLRGGLLFLAVVLPWYLLAEAHNPGYLNYYFWAEHFGRYTTASFDRSEAWYYFIIVLLVGFFPWTLFLPWMIKNLCVRTWDDRRLYLILWVVVFSASNSKLPHYILPIFPALCILAGATMVCLYEGSAAKLGGPISGLDSTNSERAVSVARIIYPTILAHQIRDRFTDMTDLLWFYSIGSLLVLGFMATRIVNKAGARQGVIYVANACGLCLFLMFVTRMMVAVSPDRSAKRIAMAVLAELRTGQQVGLFETYMSGWPFYLRASRPLVDRPREQKARLSRKLSFRWKAAGSIDAMGKSNLQCARVS